MTSQIQPIFILPEGSQRTTGKSAQSSNIMAAKAVADTVRTTLGPKGMDKMLVDGLGDIVITNDGVTILEEMNVEHPAAKMIVEVSKTQEDEVGDGTTTAVVVAGELLKKAEELLDQEIHPTLITKGYRMASEKALEVLNTISEPVTENDTELLEKIAVTAMTGKGAEHAKVQLAKLAVKGVRAVADNVDGTLSINKDNIKIEKKVGGSVEDSELVEGIILDKEKVHPAMADITKDAKVALIDAAVEVKSTETEAKIQITDPAQLQGFIDMEEKILREKVEKLVKSGANVVFCQKGIDDLAQHFMAKKGIYAARRVSKSDMEKLARATGGKIVTSLDDLSKDDLGSAGVVEAKKVGDEDMTFVKECKNAKAVTLLIRGGTEHVVDEIKRAMDDAIGDVASALSSGKVVAGAGATETELALQLRRYADSLSGREQLAVKAFAEAIEVIPRTLAENSGLDPIDIMTELKAQHDKGKKWAGINVFTGKVIDSWNEEGVIEPLKVKTQAISSASEVACMILRIDDVIASGKSEAGGGMPPGMPPGGMPEY
jgi:archaeal chaperonin